MIRQNDANTTTAWRSGRVRRSNHPGLLARASRRLGPTLALTVVVPETPEERLYARAAGALRMPPVETWDTFPFDGELAPRGAAAALSAQEEPRRGAGGRRLLAL